MVATGSDQIIRIWTHAKLHQDSHWSVCTTVVMGQDCQDCHGITYTRVDMGSYQMRRMNFMPPEPGLSRDREHFVWHEIANSTRIDMRLRALGMSYYRIKCKGYFKCQTAPDCHGIACYRVDTGLDQIKTMIYMPNCFRIFMGSRPLGLPWYRIK
jgi:hypothetical protein